MSRVRRFWTQAGVLALAAAAPVTPVLAQEGAREQLDRLLNLFGLSCGEIVFFLLALFVVAWLALYLSARLAGLEGGLGKAFGVMLMQGLLSVFAGIVAAFLPVPKEGMAAVLASQAINVLVGAFVVRWFYSTSWKRAFFTAVSAATLSLFGLIVLVYVIF